MSAALRSLSTLLLALLPACGNLNFYADEELEPLSLQAYEETTNEHGQVTSGPAFEMVQRVAQRIAAVAEMPEFKWQARLLKADDTPNAFCLPNGRIAIYTGILPVTQNEDGLAIVMGHEVAHAVLRHGGKRMTQGRIQQATQEAIGQGLAVTQMGETARSGLMALFGIGGNLLFTLPYSRDHESDADIEGLRYAIRAGYDPEEAPKLWERMAKLSSGSSTPEWLSTHPNSEARAQTLREMIPVVREQEKNWRPKATTTPTTLVPPTSNGAGPPAPARSGAQPK